MNWHKYLLKYPYNYGRQPEFYTALLNNVWNNLRGRNENFSSIIISCACSVYTCENI
jgi:hypothetical protein